MKLSKIIESREEATRSFTITVVSPVEVRVEHLRLRPDACGITRRTRVYKSLEVDVDITRFGTIDVRKYDDAVMYKDGKFFINIYYNKGWSDVK